MPLASLAHRARCARRAHRRPRTGLAAGAALFVVAASAALLPWPAVPGEATGGQSVASGPVRWRPVLDGLYGDRVVDLVFVGDSVKGTRSMLLVPEGRGVFEVNRDGGWDPVPIHPMGRRWLLKAIALARDDIERRRVYVGFEGQVGVIYMFYDTEGGVPSITRDDAYSLHFKPYILETLV